MKEKEVEKRPEQTVTDVISKPTENEGKPADVTGSNAEGFAFFETIGARGAQEDALVWLGEGLDAGELSPEEIGYRLWSTHKKLDATLPEEVDPQHQGTTASSNYYDGKGNIITATLADAASFAVIYGKGREVLKVVRLNALTHKPDDASEKIRIEEAGDKVSKLPYAPCAGYRVNGTLAVSRAIGDNQYKSVTAESRIDIHSIEKLRQEIKAEAIESIEIITTCDGFTDGAGRLKQEKADHEAYLRDCLSNAKSKTAADLCKDLAQSAINSRSGDNISVAIQTIYKNGQMRDKPAFIAVYDGHCGSKVSSYVADNVGATFRAMLQMPRDLYELNEYSVFKEENAASYVRDHQSQLSQQQYKKEEKEECPQEKERNITLQAIRQKVETYTRAVWAIKTRWTIAQSAQNAAEVNPNDLLPNCADEISNNELSQEEMLFLETDGKQHPSSRALLQDYLLAQKEWVDRQNWNLAPEQAEVVEKYENERFNETSQDENLVLKFILDHPIAFTGLAVGLLVVLSVLGAGMLLGGVGAAATVIGVAATSGALSGAGATAAGTAISFFGGTIAGVGASGLASIVVDKCTGKP